MAKLEIGDKVGREYDHKVGIIIDGLESNILKVRFVNCSRWIYAYALRKISNLKYGEAEMNELLQELIKEEVK